MRLNFAVNIPDSVTLWAGKVLTSVNAGLGTVKSKIDGVSGQAQNALNSGYTALTNLANDVATTYHRVPAVENHALSQDMNTGTLAVSNVARNLTSQTATAEIAPPPVTPQPETYEGVMRQIFAWSDGDFLSDTPKSISPQENDKRKDQVLQAFSLLREQGFDSQKRRNELELLGMIGLSIGKLTSQVLPVRFILGRIAETYLFSDRQQDRDDGMFAVETIYGKMGASGWNQALIASSIRSVIHDQDATLRKALPVDVERWFTDKWGPTLL